MTMMLRAIIKPLYYGTLTSSLPFTPFHTCQIYTPYITIHSFTYTTPTLLTYIHHLQTNTRTTQTFRPPAPTRTCAALAPVDACSLAGPEDHVATLRVDAAFVSGHNASVVG